MKSGLIPASLSMVALVTACSAKIAPYGLASSSVGQIGFCDVQDFQKGATADLTTDNTAFARLILNDPNVTFTQATGISAKCPTTILEVLSALDHLPRATRKIYEVDETGDQLQAGGLSDGNHRFVVAQGLGDAQSATGGAGITVFDLFLSALEAEPGKLDLTSLEVIAFDPTREVNVFYKFMNGQWNLMGDGTQIDPQKSQDVARDQNGAPAGFFCQSCHPTGALNMKERKAPWNNWDDTKGSEIHLPKFPATDHLLNAWINGDAALPAESTIFPAPGLETDVEKGNARLVQARVKHVLSGDVLGAFPGQSLATLVREIMCPVGEVNVFYGRGVSRIAGTPAAVTMNHPQFNMQVPSTLMVDEFFTRLPGSTIAPPVVPGDVYHSVISSQSIADIPGAHDAMLGFVVPERSFTSMLVEDALVASGWLTQENVAAILLTDFPNPMFSKQRCDLASTIPSLVPGSSASDATNGAASFLASWISSLNASLLPGAAGLGRRLGSSGQVSSYAARAVGLLSACTRRIARDAAGTTSDLVALVQQRREELRQDAHLNRGNQGFPQIIESPDLFPQASNLATPGALHLQEDCTLTSTAPDIQ